MIPCTILLGIFVDGFQKSFLCFDLNFSFSFFKCDIKLRGVFGGFHIWENVLCGSTWESCKENDLNLKVSIPLSLPPSWGSVREHQACFFAEV